MNNFPSVLETIADLTEDQVRGLLSLSKKLKRRDEDHATVFQERRPIIATSFLENSTRTKHSFAVAIHKLGATYLDFNAETSSLKKGESLEETLLTLNCQGVELCIIRTGQSYAFTPFKASPPIKIINGGDGTHEHPTQALLDVFTMEEFELLRPGSTVAIIGDCVHSRVTHSLLKLLPMFEIKIILCGPKVFLPVEEEINPQWVTLCDDLDEAITQSDLLYLLRIQKERHAPTISMSDQDYHQAYGLNSERMRRLNRFLPCFHPGPANVGVEISQELMHSSSYFGYEQVKNSVFMRMAIIQSMILNGDKRVGLIQNGKRRLN
jgi:aspartate carbamoyltransferase catalytic subunit